MLGGIGGGGAAIVMKWLNEEHGAASVVCLSYQPLLPISDFSYAASQKNKTLNLLCKVRRVLVPAYLAEAIPLQWGWFCS